MPRAKVNYTLPAKNFRTLVYWAHGGRVFDGRESILPARRKKTGYGLGARTWIAPAIYPRRNEHGSSGSAPARAPDRSNRETRERSRPRRKSAEGS